MATRKKQGAEELLKAAMNGDHDTLRTLLDAGADVDALDKSTRWSPLMNACSMGYWRTVEMLLDAGADVNLTNRWGEAALAVAMHGATMAPDVKPGQRKVRDYCRTVQILIDRGADVNVNTWHSTPLAMAEQRELDEIAKVLRSAGGKVACKGETVAVSPPRRSATASE
jgi:ankyrin repeat protein